MPELETALRQLGRDVDFPATPDLASAIGGRLERPRRSLRPVAIAVAILVVAIGAVLAVPSARTAILDWLGLRNVSVVRVDKLPRVKPLRNLDLGEKTTVDEAKQQVRWLLLPDQKPDAVYMSDSLPGGKVTLLWGTPSSPRLMLTELTGHAYIEKIVQGDQAVEPVRIGDAGAWFSGDHIVMYSDRAGIFHEGKARLAGNTLVWQVGGTTLRLEGDLTKAEALRIARTVD
jgi:hypothetical protein